ITYKLFYLSLRYSFISAIKISPYWISFFSPTPFIFKKSSSFFGLFTAMSLSDWSEKIIKGGTFLSFDKFNLTFLSLSKRSWSTSDVISFLGYFLLVSYSTLLAKNFTLENKISLDFSVRARTG